MGLLSKQLPICPMLNITVKISALPFEFKFSISLLRMNQFHSIQTAYTPLTNCSFPCRENQSDPLSLIIAADDHKESYKIPLKQKVAFDNTGGFRENLMALKKISDKLNATKTENVMATSRFKKRIFRKLNPSQFKGKTVVLLTSDVRISFKFSDCL